MFNEKEIDILVTLIDAELQTIEELGIPEKSDILRQYASSLLRIRKKLLDIRKFHCANLVFHQVGFKILFNDTETERL
ncbi:MAG: hypothetical protein ABH883_05335 [Candidatus Omnitrophota bacterium]